MSRTPRLARNKHRSGNENDEIPNSEDEKDDDNVPKGTAIEVEEHDPQRAENESSNNMLSKDVTTSTTLTKPTLRKFSQDTVSASTQEESTEIYNDREGNAIVLDEQHVAEHVELVTQEQAKKCPPPKRQKPSAWGPHVQLARSKGSIVPSKVFEDKD